MNKKLKLTDTDEERVREIHKKAIVINMCEVTGSIAGFERLVKDDFRDKLNNLGQYLGAVTVSYARGFNESIPKICDFLDKVVFGNTMKLVTSLKDLDDAKKEKKPGMIFAFQGADAIEYDLSLLRLFYGLGLRVVQLGYNYDNFLGSGCYSRVDTGLTNFGIAVVEEMNKLGILVDLSHTGIKTTFETINISKAPVIFSHSNAKAIFNVNRNLTDEQMKAIAEKDGVIGLCAWNSIIRQPKSSDDFTTTEDLLEHFDYMVKIVGVDHLGFGLDFPEYPRPSWIREMAGPSRLTYGRMYDVASWPREKTYCLKSMTEFPNFTRGLIQRGYTDEEILKILGGNFLRVLNQVWKV